MKKAKETKKIWEGWGFSFFEKKSSFRPHFCYKYFWIPEAINKGGLP
jgi:hypothetical protein